jgi:hypothetical protein
MPSQSGLGSLCMPKPTYGQGIEGVTYSKGNLAWMNLGTLRVSQYLLVGVLRPLSTEEGHCHEVVIPGQEPACA